MKKLLKVLLYAAVSVLGLCLLIPVGSFLRVKYEYHLSPERRASVKFASNRVDYIRLVTLLKDDRSARFIDNSGTVDIDGLQSRQVPEYRQLIRRIGAKQVLIREDGSIDFPL